MRGCKQHRHECAGDERPAVCHAQPNVATHGAASSEKKRKKRGALISDARRHCCGEITIKSRHEVKADSQVTPGGKVFLDESIESQ